jgi:FecR protein
MRHPYFKPARGFSWPGKSFQFVISALALSLLLVAGAAAQETAPPPPPDPLPQTSTATNNGPENPAPGSDVRAVRLSDVEGKVQVLNGSEQAFDQAQPNMPVMEGMKLVTGGNGRVEIQFEDGSVARVTPNSTVTLTQLHRNGDGSTVTEIVANAGLSYYELNGRAGQYTVRFGSNFIAPADSSIFRVNLDQNPEVAVTHGSVHVSDGQNLAVDVKTNQSLRFTAQNSSDYDVVQSVTADSWDQWNSDRDQALATLDESATTARASSGNPDDPAWSDLDYYGDWYDVPGYGEAWAPSGVGQDFDPFGNGSWGYYSGVGYSWISGYSWGWWPYHCGAWNYFNSFGWMWFPGNCGWGGAGAGWYPYATVWRIPPGYRVPVRPTAPGRGPGHHGPIPHPVSLIAVNRTSDAGQQFRSIGQPKAAARSFNYSGEQIRPEVSSVYSRQGGPLGEGFTTSAERSHPEVLDQQYRGIGLPGSGNSVSASRNAYQTAPRGNGAPYNPGYRPASPAAHPAWGGSPSRPSEAPHYSPPPAPPAAHPSAGGHPH